MQQHGCGVGGVCDVRGACRFGNDGMPCSTNASCTSSICHPSGLCCNRLCNSECEECSYVIVLLLLLILQSVSIVFSWVLFNIDWFVLIPFWFWLLLGVERARAVRCKAKRVWVRLDVRNCWKASHLLNRYIIYLLNRTRKCFFKTQQYTKQILSHNLLLR